MDDKTMMKPGGRDPRKPSNSPRYSPKQEQAQYQQQSSDDGVTRVFGQHEQSPPQNKPLRQSLNHSDGQENTTSDVYFTEVERIPISGGVNRDLRVIDTVMPLLTVASKLHSASEAPNLKQFWQFAVDQIHYYESVKFGLQNDNAELEQTLVRYAKYGLCTMIDEFVQNTPWGATSDWSQKSMLVTFFKETWGGEKFFDYLKQMQEYPEESLAVLSFYYVCLELGFFGRYRDVSNGQSQQSQLKTDLYLMISRSQKRPDTALSVNWRGIDIKGNGIIKHIPVWVMMTVSSALTLLVFLGFYFNLAGSVEPVNLQMVKIIQQKPLDVEPSNFSRLGHSVSSVIVTEQEVATAEEPDLTPISINYADKLTELLATEIAKGTVILESRRDEILLKLMVVDNELFASASVTLTPEYLAIVDKVGRFMAHNPSLVTVTGHTDNLPVRKTIKYPDNQALSEARAEQVKSRLQMLSGDTEIRAYGAADAYPVASNDNKEGRRQNRRVEIRFVN